MDSYTQAWMSRSPGRKRLADLDHGTGHPSRVIVVDLWDLPPLISVIVESWRGRRDSNRDSDGQGTCSNQLNYVPAVSLG